MGQRGLRIKIDTQHAVAIKGRRMRHVQGNGRFARTAFEVGNRHPHRPFARRAFGHQRMAVDFHPAAQLVDLGQRKPALAAVFLDLAARKVGFSGKAAPKGGLVDLEDQFRHFPAGKAAQGLFMFRAEGLTTNPALHLQRLRLQGGEVFVGIHCRSARVVDVDQR